MLCLFILLMLAADQGWKNKRAADWTDAETRQVLADSPWAAMVTPTIKKETPHQPGNHGVGIAGVPGMNRRRMEQPQETNSSSEEARPFNIRWESALPVREAELKARETTAPDVDENHYAIAIYGIPNRLAKTLGDHLKGQSALKRENQKDLKPSSVQVIQRDDGLVVVFLFPKTKEITTKDSRMEFEAQIGPYQFSQAFHADEMIYQGKPEL
jgi:hypothetical protein